jgi:hypothetical protein
MNCSRVPHRIAKVKFVGPWGCVRACLIALCSKEFNELDSALDEIENALNNLENQNDTIQTRLRELLESNREIRKDLMQQLVEEQKADGPASPKS